jgi:hypothetical protein
MPALPVRTSDRDAWLAARRNFVGASEVAALLNIHPHISPLELWMRKTGIMPDQPETAPMRRGRLLEPVALALLAEERPDWRVASNALPDTVMFQDQGSRLSCTPDAWVEDPTRGRGIVQIKSVSPRTWRRVWHEDGQVELPVWIGVQASLETYLSGAQWACVAALVVEDGLTLEIIDVPLVPGLLDRLEMAAAEFWRCVETREPPMPDYARDLALIKAMHPSPNPGQILDAEGDNELTSAVEDYLSYSAALGTISTFRERAEAVIRDRLGDAEAARTAGYTITLKSTTRKAYTCAETSFRTLRIAARKDVAAITGETICPA